MAKESTADKSSLWKKEFKTYRRITILKLK
jgi:hypothetical protein